MNDDDIDPFNFEPSNEAEATRLAEARAARELRHNPPPKPPREQLR